MHSGHFRTIRFGTTVVRIGNSATPRPAEVLALETPADRSASKRLAQNWLGPLYERSATSLAMLYRAARGFWLALRTMDHVANEVDPSRRSFARGNQQVSWGVL